MKTSLPNLAAAGLLAVVWTLPAHASLELARKKACMACHQVERKVVGPSYAEIAKRYRGQADAAAVLAESIRKGGSGRWGPAPMPAQPNLSEADALVLAKWVLNGAK